MALLTTLGMSAMDTVVHTEEDHDREEEGTDRRGTAELIRAASAKSEPGCQSGGEGPLR